MKNKSVNKSILFLVLLLSILTSNAFAKGKAEIVTEQLRVILPPSVASSTSAYGIIKNTGDTGDTLINVSSDAGMVMLHKTDISKGMAQMNHVGEYVLEAGAELVLKPMSYHLMIMNVNHTIVQKNKEVTLVLEFEKSGKLELKVPVVEE